MVFKTDIGNCRNENQDNFRAGTKADGTTWALICDGMGGAKGGAIASNTVAQVVENFFDNSFDVNFTGEQILSFMRTVLDKANEIVYKGSLNDKKLSGMGTTAVLVVVKNETVYIAHIGDSRAYLYRNKTVTQLTKDHSMVQQLVEKGTITAEQALNHPGKNYITRAIGIAQQMVCEYNTIKIKKDDILFLCTDGLSNYVTTEDFEKIITTENFYNLANVLVGKALRAGGSDNITVMLLKANAVED
ncbi:MAG: Stp1/IreP family PP2C-type Ser/Thr phosphatase [Oscillospiraceae bacterium]